MCVCVCVCVCVCMYVCGSSLDLTSSFVSGHKGALGDSQV